MDETAVGTWISEAFDDVERIEVDGNTFFFYDPEHQFPFATLVTSNRYDHASDLDREGVYRLNVEVGRETWTERFGPPTKGRPGDHGLGSGSDATWDFAALDVVMPHPIYGRMHWVCVLNPSEATFETVKPLLAEAYDLNVARTAKRGATNARRSG